MLEPIRHILEKETIIFASGSPSRKMIVRDMGLDGIIRFEPSTFEENLDPNEYTFSHFVEETARHKVLEVEQRLQNQADVVMAADTMVVVGGTMYGKPTTNEEARTMLRSLSGRSSQVLTGMVIKRRGRELIRFTETSTVHFGTITEAQIEAYVNTGDPMNYAGGYAIQGRAGTFIERIEGNYFSILGLPIHKMCQKLYELYAPQ